MKKLATFSESPIIPPSPPHLQKLSSTTTALLLTFCCNARGIVKIIVSRRNRHKWTKNFVVNSRSFIISGVERKPSKTRHHFSLPACYKRRSRKCKICWLRRHIPPTKWHLCDTDTRTVPFPPPMLSCGTLLCYYFRFISLFMTRSIIINSYTLRYRKIRKLCHPESERFAGAFRETSKNIELIMNFNFPS